MVDEEKKKLEAIHNEDVIKIGKLEFEKQLIEKKLKTLSEKQSRCEERLSEKKDENQKLISDNQRLFSIKTNLERELYDKNEVIRNLSAEKGIVVIDCQSIK